MSADLVRLQQAQLQSAAAAFAHSTETIDRNLGDIASRVGEMAADSSRIHGGDDRKSGDSFLDGMQRRLTAVVQAAAASRSLELAMRSVAGDLHDTRQSLGAAVDEVQSFESDLYLISTNAVVSASRIRRAGTRPQRDRERDSRGKNEMRIAVRGRRSRPRFDWRSDWFSCRW